METEIKKYAWRSPFVGKGVDAEEVLKELERVECDYGALTPENVVREAKEEGSILHYLFEWDDEKAAHKYRLQQARGIINNIEVIIISDGKQKHIPIFEIIKLDNNTKVYKHIDSFTENEVEQIKANAIREIAYWKNKLAMYNKFSKVIDHLDNAINSFGS